MDNKLKDYADACKTPRDPIAEMLSEGKTLQEVDKDFFSSVAALKEKRDFSLDIGLITDTDSESSYDFNTMLSELEKTYGRT